MFHDAPLMDTAHNFCDISSLHKFEISFVLLRLRQVPQLFFSSLRDKKYLFLVVRCGAVKLFANNLGTSITKFNYSYAKICNLANCFVWFPSLD